MQFEKMELANVGDGALEAEFKRALREVVDDIYDEAKNPTAPRQISLKVAFKPSENSGAVDVVVSSAVTRAPSRSYRSHATLAGRELMQFRDVQQELPLGTLVNLEERSAK